MTSIILEHAVQAIKGFFATIWKYWKKFGHFMGDLVGRIFLMLFYITIALPFGLIAALTTDPLQIKDQKTAGRWLERKSPEETLEASYNQF
jgi:hypothetical protein